MIPSRPLNIGDIFAQTFSIFGRSFTRYLLLFVVFYIPGAALATYGVIEFTKDVVTVAQSEAGFNDRDLTGIRNRFRERFVAENPAFREQVQGAIEADTAKQPAVDSTASALPPSQFRLTGFVLEHLSTFSSTLGLLSVGMFLLLLGLIGITSGVIDLACQAFEERPLDLRDAVRDTVRKYAWRILLLYVLYILLSILQNEISSLLLGISETAGSLIGVLLVSIEFYLFVRLSLTVPALVSEDLGPFAAVRRSWQLTSGNWVAMWLRIWGLFFVLAIFLVGVWVFITVVSSIFLGGEALMWWTDFLKLAHLTIPEFLRGFSSFARAMVLFLSVPLMLLFPFLPIFTTVLYYDLRTRRDGPLDYSDEHYDSQREDTTPVLWQP